MNLRRVALAQGLFNVANGLWPILHLRSFEAVFGPKYDRWLVFTVAGLMACAGVTQLVAVNSVEGQRAARVLGVGVAGTLLTIDSIYVPVGRIRWTYALDGAAELGWLGAWAAASREDARAALVQASVPV